jgi:hypothetical protein
MRAAWFNPFPIGGLGLVACVVVVALLLAVLFALSR